jgi:hypothetical protein
MSSVAPNREVTVVFRGALPAYHKNRSPVTECAVKRAIHVTAVPCLVNGSRHACTGHHHAPRKSVPTSATALPESITASGSAVFNRVVQRARAGNCWVAVVNVRRGQAGSKTHQPRVAHYDLHRTGMRDLHHCLLESRAWTRAPNTLTSLSKMSRLPEVPSVSAPGGTVG